MALAACPRAIQDGSESARQRAGEDVFDAGTIVVPLRGEEAVVSKETVVTGEVVIDKGRVAEERTITDTVRKQRVEVVQTAVPGRGGGPREGGTR